MIIAALFVFASHAGADTATWTAKDGLPAITAVCEDGDTLLVGGPDGLYRFDGTKFVAEEFTQVGPPGIAPITVMRAHEGLDARWLGTSDGLRKYLPDGRMMRFGRIEAARPLKSETVTAIELEALGLPWVATRGHVFHNTGGPWVEVFDGRLPIAGVVSLAHGPDSMWMSTSDRVIRFFGTGPFVVHGLPWPSIFLEMGTTVSAGAATDLPGLLAVDEEGTLWIGRANGLWRVRDTAERIDTRAVTALVGPRLFVANTDGVFAIEAGKLVRVLDHGASYLHVGKRALWAVGDRTLSLVTIASGDSPPALELGTPALSRDGGTAKLVVEYSVPGAVGSRGMEFRYRLDGLDRDWIAAGARTRAVYEELGPGSYTFRVSARTPYSAWGDEAAYAFRIEPKFWQTKWFEVLALGLLSLLLFALAFVLHVRKRRRDVAAAAAVEKRVETEVASARETERLAAYGQMVAGVAHEVRQPLFAISTVSYTLGEKLKEMNDPALAPQMQLLDREVKRMSSMMDDLLDFARPAQLLLGPTEVTPLLAETLDIVGLDGEGGAELAIGNVDVKEVVIDRARMQQVLVNLVANARKHAQGAKRIELSASRDGDLVTLQVRDDGAGIPPERVARLFEPFFTTGKGTGLGLPIAKRIVELHEGTLTVRSDESGTCFTITIPQRGT